MPTVCVDASLAVKLIFAEDGSSLTEALWRRWQADSVECVAPFTMPVEVASVICHRAYRRLITADEARVAFSVLESLTIRYLFFPGLVKRAFDLAEDMGQPTVYDTIYAAVAEAVQCELWTADAAFHRAASSRLPFIRLLAETA